MKILGMGTPELLIILVVVLLIFGPKNLPKLGSAIGKSMKGLREGLGSGKKAEEALDELASACHLAEALVDNHGTGLAFCGTCDVCGRDMLAPPGSSQAYCRPCGLVYPMDGRRAWLLDQLDSQLAGAADLARAITFVAETPRGGFIANMELQPEAPLAEAKERQSLALGEEGMPNQ